MIGLELGNIKTMEKFIKYFTTEFERENFIKKLKYSKKLIVLRKVN